MTGTGKMNQDSFCKNLFVAKLLERIVSTYTDRAALEELQGREQG